MDNNLFQVYRAKLKRESVVTSLCLGLAAGAGVNLVSAFCFWLLGLSNVWITVLLGAVSFAIASALFYFLRFRPTDKRVARKMDEMGLEERAVTMLDLKDDDSFIAKKQRADAEKKIASVDKITVQKTFPLFALKSSAIVLITVLFVSGAGMTTVAALSDAGTLPSPGILKPNDPQNRYFSVTYLTEGGGEIEGEPDQLILYGESATTVVAVPEDGWAFSRWSDGSKNPERTDVNITDEFTVTAIFEEVEGGGDPAGGDDDQGPGKEGDKDDEAPDENNNDGNGMGGGDGDGGEGNGDGDNGDGNGKGDGGQEGDGKGDGKGDGAGGGWSDEGKIIDGTVDYRDVYQTYYEMAMDILNNGGELSPELRAFIEKYYGSI